MSDNNFLKNLKEALDKEEFNSDAAKRFNSINYRVDNNLVDSENVKKRIEKIGKRQLTPEEIVELDRKFEEFENKNENETVILNRLRELFAKHYYITELSLELNKLINEFNDDYLDNLNNLPDSEKLLNQYNELKKLYK